MIAWATCGRRSIKLLAQQINSPARSIVMSYEFSPQGNHKKDPMNDDDLLLPSTNNEKILLDVPETLRGGVCSGKAHPPWFGYCCGVGFSMIAIAMLAALILGGVSRYDCPAVPELPYSLIVFSLFGILKFVELFLKNLLVACKDTTTCLGEHPQMKCLFVLWAVLDMLFNLIIAIMFCASLYWTSAAQREISKAVNISSADKLCEGRLVNGSFSLLFGFTVILVLLVAVTIFRCCLSQSSINRRRTSYGYTDAGGYGGLYVDEGCTDLTGCCFCLPFFIHHHSSPHCCGDNVDGCNLHHCIAGGDCFGGDCHGCGQIDCNGCCDCNGCDCGHIDCGHIDCGHIDCSGVDCSGMDCNGCI